MEHTIKVSTNLSTSNFHVVLLPSNIIFSKILRTFCFLQYCILYANTIKIVILKLVNAAKYVQYMRVMNNENFPLMGCEKVNIVESY